MSANRSKLHYRPATGFFGDPIPFYWEGEYHVFYLEAQVDPYRRFRFTPFNHLVSTDLVNWEELPVAIPLGGPDDIDMSLGTGSVIAHDDQFYFLYCGRRFNPKREAICLATSPDLIHWEKHPGNPILVPDDSQYAPSDFRDPFPFWVPEDDRFWMVISSKLAVPSTPRPGCLALAVSKDLVNWELRPPFYAPNLHAMALECPDVFEAQGRRYTIYSADRRTFYREADRLAGPWRAAGPDRTHYYVSELYAPKTLSDGERRFLFGFLGTKGDERDDGSWEYGGDMAIPRELVPLPGGDLAERCPKEILAACGQRLEHDLDFRLGRWWKTGQAVTGRRSDGLAYAAVQNCPQDLLLELSIKLAPATGAAGILFRASADLGTFYALRLEPGWSRVVVERWDAGAPGEKALVLAERPLEAIAGRTVTVQLFLDGDIIEIFVDGLRAMCCRAYDHKTGELGIFVENGAAAFENIGLRYLP